MRDGLAQKLQKTRYHDIRCRGGVVERVSTRARKVSSEEVDESEGYDESEQEH